MIIYELFTSNMHLLLIFPPHETIDSITDLYHKPNMKIIIINDILRINFQKTDIEKAVFNRPMTITYDIFDILQHIGRYLNLIGKSKTHVFITDNQYGDAIFSANEYTNFISNKGNIKAELHMSTEHEFQLPQSFLYRKNLDPFLSNHLVDIVTTLYETGCYEKWLLEMASFGGKISKSLQNLMATDSAIEVKAENGMASFLKTLEAFFVAAVIFNIGIAVAVFVFVFELIGTLQIRYLLRIFKCC